MKSEETRRSRSETTKVRVTAIFVIACAIFIGYLFIVTIYETFVTRNLPTDDDSKAESISEIYLPPLKTINPAFGQPIELENEVNDSTGNQGIIHSILLTANYQQLYAILYNYSQPLENANFTLHLDKNLTKEQQANINAVALDTTGAGKNMTRPQAEEDPEQVDVGGEDIPFDEAVNTDEQVHEEEAENWKEEQDIGDKDKPIVIEGEGVKDTTPEEEDELSSGEVFGNGQTESTEDPEASRNNDNDDSDIEEENNDDNDNDEPKMSDNMGLFKQ